MFKRPCKDEYFLDIALAVSKRSTCLKRHYGVVIVQNDIIVATGYNGSARDQANCCDTHKCLRADKPRYTNHQDCVSIHAETNALMSVGRHLLLGATMYIACETTNLDPIKNIHDTGLIWSEDKNPLPCVICWRMLSNSGVGHVKNRMGIIYPHQIVQ